MKRDRLVKSATDADHLVLDQHGAYSLPLDEGERVLNDFSHSKMDPLGPTRGDEQEMKAFGEMN